MFFIYLFFGIGILATLLLILPTIVEIAIYLYSIFANIKTAKENKSEVRKALLNKKKELKLAKINGDQKQEEVVEVDEPVVEVPVAEEEKQEEVVEPTIETNETKEEPAQNI
ncbi:MAG: hypothetical protein J6J36_06795 [Clostridia bacterium]|nr:hypothetical protein [Clostridia bacterium]